MTWQFAETDTLTLIHICNHDDIDLDTRYKAANELQYRIIPNEIQAEVLYLHGIGKPLKDIAYQVGLSEEQTKEVIEELNKRHRWKWEKGLKHRRGLSEF